MKLLKFFVLFIFMHSLAAATWAKTGRIFTEIGSIPDQLSVWLASKPDALLRPDADGAYAFTPSDNDYLIILPVKEDQFIYSPRIIPAERAGADTLFIIPPTFTEYTIIVDNQTEQALTFLADEALVSEALVTAKKDYQLTIIPRRTSVSDIYVAAFTDGFTAAVHQVKFQPNKTVGYMTITPQDLGMPPVAKAPTKKPAAPVIVPPAKPEPEPIVEIERPAGPIVEQEKVAEPLPPPPEKKIEPISEPVVVASRPEPPVKIQNERTRPKQTAAFINNRFFLKDAANLVLSAAGEYSLYSSPNLSRAGVLLGVHNIQLVQQNFDLILNISQSPDLGGYLYEASVIWTPLPFVALDMTRHGANSEAWRSEYYVSRTSFGLNGAYLLDGGWGQFGVGARFCLDFADFGRYVPGAVESGARYLPSIYALTTIDHKNSTTGLMLGVVDESIYFSLAHTFHNRIGFNYSWKSKSQQDDLLSPLESRQQHRVQLSYHFNLVERR